MVGNVYFGTMLLGVNLPRMSLNKSFVACFVIKICKKKIARFVSLCCMYIS